MRHRLVFVTLLFNTSYTQGFRTMLLQQLHLTHAMLINVCSVLGF